MTKSREETLTVPVVIATDDGRQITVQVDVSYQWDGNYVDVCARQPGWVGHTEYTLEWADLSMAEAVALAKLYQQDTI